MTTRTQNIRDMVWAHVYALRYERATAAGMEQGDAKEIARYLRLFGDKGRVAHEVVV